MSHDPVRRRLCIIALGMLAGVRPAAAAGGYSGFVAAMSASPPEGSQYRPDLEETLARLVNGYRTEEGKEPLTPDGTCLAAARAHAADMMVNGFMGHRSSTGLSFEGRMRALAGDVTKFPAIGENAARDTQDTPVDDSKARAILRQWVKSRAHRKVMVNRSFRFVSTGVIQREQKIWAVQIFFGTPRNKGLFQ